MADALSADDKLVLIHDNLQEVLKPGILEDVIRKQNRPLKIYWGEFLLGRPHCAYFVPVVKIAQFLRAGCAVKILLADFHGFLDNLKAPIELVKYRATYYKYIITALLKSIHVPIEKLEFVLGSSYQTSEKYVVDLFRLSMVVSHHDGMKAGAEVIKQVESPPIGGLLYPLMQALDEQYLGVDAQFGGIDQRKIFTLAAEKLPKIDYEERAHLMNPMVPGLAGGKMSASDPDSKIDVLEEPKNIKRKLKKAHAVPKEVEGNGVISFVEYVLLPVSAMKEGGRGTFLVERQENKPLIYTDIARLKEDYAADTLTPQLLKTAAAEALIKLLEPIQTEFQNSEEWKDVEKKAYPPHETKKKEKKVKNLGTRFPGAARDVTAQPDGHVEGSGENQVNLSTDAEGAMQNLDIETNGPS